MNKKNSITIFFILITIFSIWITFIHIDWLNQIQAIAQDTGEWGALIFVIAYAITTLLILPVTALNIAGGAIYGGMEGILLTSIGALVSALIAFVLARSLGNKFIPTNDRWTDRWTSISDNLIAGGIAYSFASRLFPLIPYGVVSFVAGLSPINYRDYLIGTLLGTPLGIAPFVFLGSTGVRVIDSHDVLPLLASSLALGGLIVAGVWYQQSRKTIQAEVAKEKHGELTEQ